MKPETLKAIIAAFNATSDDATRYHINHVLIRPAANGLRIVATDGHKLSDVFCEDACVDQFTVGKDYFAAPEQITALKAILKNWKHGVPCKTSTAEARPDGAIVRGSVVLGDISVNVYLRQGVVEFLDIDIIRPRNMPADAFVVSLNAEYLMELARSMGANRDKRAKPTVTLTFKDKLSPILVLVDGNTGLLMPCRI